MIEYELDSATLLFPVESAPSYVSVVRPIRTILCLLLSDFTGIVVSLFLAFVIRHLLGVGPGQAAIGSALPAIILVLCSFVAAGLYPGVCINPVDELRRTAMSITLAFLFLWSATFFLHDLTPSRLVYVLAYMLAVFLIPMLRTATRAIFAHQSWWGNPVAILGYGKTGRLVLDTLLKNPRIGLRPIAVLDDDQTAFSDLRPGITRGPLAHCIEIANQKISYGIVCMPGLSRRQLLQLLDGYGQCFSHILVIPDLIGMSSVGISARELGGIVGLEVTQQLLRPSAQLIKRLLDLTLTLCAAPFILFVIAVAAMFIKLEGKGPIFYGNERVGRRGNAFKAWKLRSMVVDGDQVLARYLETRPAEKLYWEKTQKLKHDPRITQIGRIIRKTSIDELPQFWNVLIGEMSVVGPRPMMKNQVAMYGPSFALYKQIRPGITGLWQVSGRNELSFHERVKLDKYVIQNWSVWWDIYILARTFGVVLTAKGAY